MINEDEAINYAVGYLDPLIRNSDEQRRHLDKDIDAMSRTLQKIKDAVLLADGPCTGKSSCKG